MPELPEVETIKTSLINANLINNKISEVFRSNYKLRTNSTINLNNLKNLIIKKISRRARYLLIEFDNQTSLIIHLGMSGRLLLKPELTTEKHNHFAIKIFDNSKNNSQWLIFNDPRRFGLIDLINNNNLENHKMLLKLGPEPLSNDFNPRYLANKLANKNINIKTSLMDNQIVVGVGNIYANESLFLSKILPLRSSKSINEKEIKNLIKSIKFVLNQAIINKGSSINDYVDADGNVGNFQNNFKVYGRINQNCIKCSNNIERIIQNGRSSFFCKKCQK
ncbi:MAG: bifunctional DNA-formamidopyrimidine glycosylase/DNA-(apurinic or apyrimidinic site) lyase [Rickettsiales bacterium]|jgi:formamidopyrimidine-DNA glycosylase|nr:bifunctional DNA-formamidopyrimidine glycosylase/DNA-(apurinic or apyrimidinic site) lyase [Rickettsiales bacterium]